MLRLPSRGTGACATRHRGASGFFHVSPRMVLLNDSILSWYISPVCLVFFQLLATKSCYGPPNALTFQPASIRIVLAKKRSKST
jgi:hypothetical protein